MRQEPVEPAVRLNCSQSYSILCLPSPEVCPAAYRSKHFNVIPAELEANGNKVVYGNVTRPVHIVKDIARDELSEAKALLQSNHEISFTIMQGRDSNSKQGEELKEIVHMLPDAIEILGQHGKLDEVKQFCKLGA